MTSISRVNKIKELMIEKGISYYLIDTADPHLSEYIADYYKEREYVSGFTGSNGVLIIGINESFLWTDGRYFVQAEDELAGSGITLMRMGQKGVPTISAFLQERLTCNDNLTFNGALISASLGLELNRIAESKKALITSNVDLCDLIWSDRPLDSEEPIYLLDENITGMDSSKKLELCFSKLEDNSVDGLFISKLDDIMWLFNIRGNDIECNPVCYAYAFISKKCNMIFLKKAALTDNIREYFKSINVTINSYESIMEVLDIISNNDKIIVDKASSNYNIYNALNNHCNVIDLKNPTELLKAVKNETEIKNSIKCYLDDSVTLTKFIIWLKNEVKNNKISETLAAKKLDSMRAAMPEFIELSFPTISAYGANAAMMHYEAKEGLDAIIEEEGIYLVDSGATYYNGTTDVTRSLIMGNITDEMKMHFTLTVAGMLRLQNAVFYKGSTGRNLDILARGPLWEKGIDYKCGTGHGVGYILNVHEGPHSIRTLRRKGEEETAFEPGMIVSDEPGVYIEGSHGIRIENILLCDNYMSTNDGDFLCFKPLTLVPIDLSGIDKKYLNDTDINNLNNYHSLVRNELMPYIGDCKDELIEMTRPI